ncbi:hypothetical protein IWX50DRAFT_255562 [Phyllosticta citricarpa]|uniref:Uncharacterized protein n=1 Tax=Phyllosticta citricarpa TaxID=55181 RepID=A0ABR1LUN5_9PEZI
MWILLNKEAISYKWTLVDSPIYRLYQDTIQRRKFESPSTWTHLFNHVRNIRAAIDLCQLVFLLRLRLPQIDCGDNFGSERTGRIHSRASRQDASFFFSTCARFCLGFVDQADLFHALRLLNTSITPLRVPLRRIIIPLKMDFRLIPRQRNSYSKSLRAKPLPNSFCMGRPCSSFDKSRLGSHIFERGHFRESPGRSPIRVSTHHPPVAAGDLSEHQACSSSRRSPCLPGFLRIASSPHGGRHSPPARCRW